MTALSIDGFTCVSGISNVNDFFRVPPRGSSDVLTLDAAPQIFDASYGSWSGAHEHI